MNRMVAGLVAVLLLYALPSWGFTQTFRVAGSDIAPSCANCIVKTEAPGGVPQITILQIPSTGGSTTIHATMPNDITVGNVGFQLNRFTPQAGQSGNVCDQICVGVVKTGQGVGSVVATSCMQAQVAIASQWAEMSENFGSASVAPTDTAGVTCPVSPCSGLNCNVCAGSELYITITRFAQGSCASGTAALVDYSFTTAFFQ